MEDNVTQVEVEETKPLTFDEVLASNKEYQSEFDRRLAKSNKTFLETEKANWEKEYTERLEREKSEAEKLAKMNTEQQLNYKIEQLQKELADKDSRLNASQLKDATSKILIEKGIPSSYLTMFDFTKENADTINSKVEMLSNIRSQDLQESLNKSLRQESPRYVKQDQEDEIDPYVEGFLSEL
jgi:hypothetical protein